MSLRLLQSIRNQTYRNTSRVVQQQTTVLYTVAPPLDLPMSSTLRQRPQAKAQPESHSHAHSHGADEASALLLAIQGSTDRGSRITLIGLASNVALTMGKGVAGYTLGSAALLADAVHSASDLGADVVTLSTFRYARKPRTNLYPYGFGKFESLGSAGKTNLHFGSHLNDINHQEYLYC